MGPGQLLRFNTASLFFGIEILGELSMSGSSSKTGCGGAVGIRTSSEGSDWVAADSILDWLTGTTLSTTLVKVMSSVIL